MRRRILSWAAVVFAVSAVVVAEDTDPNLWLEDVTGEKALAWVKERNAETTAELTNVPGFQTLDKRLLEILDSKETIPFVSCCGGHLYNFRRDPVNPRGIYRRTTMDEYRKARPTWEIVLDLDALAKAEGENWVFSGSIWLAPTFDRCLLRLSRGGADAVVVREFDPTAKEFVKDGFILPEGKTRVTWKDRDTLLVGADFGPGSLTNSGYPRIVKEWKRGAKLADAPMVHQAELTDVAVTFHEDPTPGFEREFVGRSITSYESDMYLRRNGKLEKIDVPADADADAWRDLLLVKLRSPWQVGGKTYPAGALLASDFESFLRGGRKFDVLFEPTERTALTGHSETRNHILLNELDHVRSRVVVLGRENGAWTRTDMPGVPACGVATVGAVDPFTSDDYFLTVEDQLTPQTLLLGTAGGAAPQKLKQSREFFDADGLTAAQHEATSKDGTKIPYFQVSRSDLASTGDAPTLLYGYGGFEISMTPRYSALVGAAWIDKGGVFVVANIRGGGEFGPAWHQAAVKANRPRAYEDFAAVAEDLIQRKVTAPKRLGIMGGSNGGLLMGNMLTQYPQLFGAVVCQVPLLDMRRYHKLLAGASWIGEYGDPDDPKQWDFIRTFSPYQNVKKDAHYPRTLFTSSTRDDRVHPGHARKMTARMKEMGHDVLYYENVEGGHGGAADHKQSAFMNALEYSFLWKELTKTN